jgi:SpoIID/LytB domain protein
MIFRFNLKPTFFQFDARFPARSLTIAGFGLLGASTLVIGSQVVAQNSQADNPILKIGVVQRFGARSTDTLVITAPQGDRLTFQYEEKGQPKTLEATSLKAEIQLQTLPEPILDEKVVLSSHRSFESAEDSANRWKVQGLEVEVGQPERWQVWAKRDVYNTPLLRDVLLQRIQAQGNSIVYLDSTTLSQKPVVSWTIGTQKVKTSTAEIAATKNRILVTRNAASRKENLYPGRLRFQPNTYGTYTLVNQVTVEDYLRGVVPHEIGYQAPRSAIEAQAILARTYALRNLRRFQIDNYELCADTQCQVYEGWQNVSASADQAIAKTRGQVLTYRNELIDALYFSTSGGITAGFSDVWNGSNRPYLRPVVDTASSIWDLSRKSLADELNLRQFLGLTAGFNEVGWRHFRWQRTSTLTQMTQELKEYLTKNKKPLANLKKVEEATITGRAASGRVQTMQVKTDVGVVQLEKDEIIQAFAAPNSLLFYIKPNLKPDKTLQGYTFTGGGLGHGVGLSQAGSYKLASLGWSYERILNFYYPDTKLQPISASLTFWQPSSSTSPES